MCGGEKRGNTRVLASPGRRASNDYSIPLAGVHLRDGEQVSGTSAFDVLHREKAAIRLLRSASRDCSLFVRDGSPSSPLACCANLRRRPQPRVVPAEQPVFLPPRCGDGDPGTWAMAEEGKEHLWGGEERSELILDHELSN
ncbi:OSJNBb0021A09.4 [Oryza sativa (japonica cultivar-group)]|uniref:Uncharacterized protein n=1 Tax=Oryza sativa subsp. japonica TaxID=39947 RepID=Q8S2K1_ORYSJ|nr:hypothetical protein [Oryza sativa Japonica Group]